MRDPRRRPGEDTEDTLGGAGLASRRAAENLILQGRVTLNGEDGDPR